jgi:hypothetical protein
MQQRGGSGSGSRSVETELKGERMCAWQCPPRVARCCIFCLNFLSLVLAQLGVGCVGGHYPPSIPAIRRHNADSITRRCVITGRSPSVGDGVKHSMSSVQIGTLNTGAQGGMCSKERSLQGECNLCTVTRDGRIWSRENSTEA